MGYGEPSVTYIAVNPVIFFQTKKYYDQRDWRTSCKKSIFTKEL